MGDRMVTPNIPDPEGHGLPGSGDGNPSGSFFNRSAWSVLPAAAPEQLPNEDEDAKPATALKPEQPTPAPPAKIRIDPDVEFTPIKIAGVSMARCVHSGTGTHFQFGAAEHHVATLLDGTRTISDVLKQLEEDGLDWTPQDVADFVGVLVAQKIAIAQVPGPASQSATEPTADAAVPSAESSFDSVSNETTPSAANEPPAAAAQPAKSDTAPLLATVLTWCGYVISLRFPLVHAQPLAQRVLPWVRPLLGGYLMAATVASINLSMLLAATEYGRLSAELMRVFASDQWFMMILVWAGLKVIHELGHACMAAHHGVRVGRAGVMFFMFAPLAYVDVTDAWKLPRWQSRVAIALGGVYLELICASVAVWVWWMFPGGLIAHVAAQIFFIAGPATLLVNANPLLRLDGYYVVSDLVNIPNLREQGRKLVGGRIESHLFGIGGHTSHLSGWRRTFAASHAAASIVFQFIWMGGLVIVVSMWAGPVGLLVAACALLLWAVLPATRWCYRIWTYEGTGPGFSRGSHRRRIAWVALTVGTIGQFFLTLPSPMVVEVPVVARFSGEQVLRSPASGFVRHVYWCTGDVVRAGEVVLEIENDELEVERDEIRFQLEAESIEWQRNERNESLGLAEASMRRSEILQRKLSELEEQVAGMKVKATRDGEILTPQFHELEGRYVSVGEELTRIGKRSNKELLLSIGESEMKAYHDAVAKGHALRVCFRGGQWIDIVPTPMRPRGSVTVSHPALAATSGGPVPVAPAAESKTGGQTIEWIAPRFEAIVELPPSKADAVRCGEVGDLALQDKRSLARRFWMWLGGT
ncbi:site-2 protease family protein [Aporhodopirellula aestuarii]|uniref:Site-2 protease family protein n=1 Tax=Aporhodopirellula aestuarii TaxID=2950107 RepID=A0ABT0UDM6_9BACT|nr:site-2 protease family protein [Aporhodopirellula aestuarii]MCM2374871.1 site-2 protease family protein [Aporhodopirellula aestuarii]